MSFDKVLKFGGSVLKTADDVINIKNIIQETASNTQQLVVVFSAFSGITDKLIEVGNLATSQKDYIPTFQEIKNYHHNIMKDLNFTMEEINNVDKLFQKIANTLLVIHDRKKLFDDTNDYLITFGERLSNYIMYLYLSKIIDVVMVSPCDLIKTDSNFGNATVDITKTTERITCVFKNIKNKMVICAGFIGLDEYERITSLGRNGSDYTSALIASILKVKQLEIWKDIDGLYTADPKIVKNVQFIKQVSYQEMAELSSLGNKIIHIKAIAPCISAKIPILLKNCYNKSGEGTLISNSELKNYNINGIVKRDNVVVLKYAISDLVDITDFTISLQKLLPNFIDSIITISQNLTQRTISMIVLKSRLDDFLNHIQTNIINKFDNKGIETSISELSSVITIVGSNLSKAVGISGKIFSVLQKHKINIHALHDDFSTTRISFICDITNANEIIKLLHKELVESNHPNT